MPHRSPVICFDQLPYLGHEECDEKVFVTGSGIKLDLFAKKICDVIILRGGESLLQVYPVPLEKSGDADIIIIIAWFRNPYTLLFLAFTSAPPLYSSTPSQRYGFRR